MKGEQEAGEEAPVGDSTLSPAVTSSKEEGGDGARGTEWPRSLERGEDSMQAWWLHTCDTNMTHTVT